jgi:hypothetical protein
MYCERFMRTSFKTLLGASIASVSVALSAHADLSVPYQLVSTFTLPGPTYDLLPDGRLIGIASDGTVSIQSAPNSSSYSDVGSIGQVNSSGFAPSFVALSPDGSTLAIGNNEFNANNAVLFFDTAAATSGSASALSSIVSPNFTADWNDNNTIYVTGANSSTFDTVVNRLDVSGGTATTVVTPAGGFSGDVAVHAGGVYAGEGDTGDVYRFDSATLDAATNPVAITTGSFIASNASAGSIEFDSLGNIIIAGSDFDFGSGNYNGSAFVFDPVTQTSQTLTPAGSDAFYGAFFNDATGQLVVTVDDTAFVYAVPSPSTAAPMLVALAACTRRRSR